MDLNALVNSNRGFLMPILGKDNNTQMNKKNQTSIDFYKIDTVQVKKKLS